MNYIEKLKETPLQIENFLSIESANKVYTLIDNYQNWEVRSNFKQTYEFEKSKFEQGYFSYWYTNIRDKEFIHNLLKILNFDFEISRLLNDNFFVPQSIFVSKYTKGHFLSPHDDKAMDRKYAFVYNLTKDADESKGGCLNFIDDDNNITHKLLPKFNSLNIFDVVNIKNRHFVSEVTDIEYKRYSISGWLTETDIKMKSKNSLI